MKIKQNGADIFLVRYFLTPIIIAFIFNFGILFNLPNCLGWKSLFLLADPVTVRSSIIELAIGIASGTLIFFAFIQLAYSFKQFPIGIVSKYITKNTITISYIFFQLGVISTLSIFSLRENVFYINWLLSVSLFLISLIASFCYFYWLIKQFNNFGIFDLMVNRIDLKALNAYYNPLFEKAKQVSNQYGIKSKNKDIRYVSDIPTTFSPVYEIRTGDRGILRNIDLITLHRVISEIKETESHFLFRLNKNFGVNVPSPL